ncbi:CRISPR-associated helicase Cas3' [Calditerricola satsumensis]|uniref:CRISPR-associated helicase Cas3' n=1 Tax=Calditerricola satsumensis TaxID=373054 RepID=UPI00166CDA5F|nr:CRISPR-associated helicase Cas3' [Calditerricola satsumensis]
MIPFAACWARPSQRLSDHLDAVARAMAPSPKSPEEWLARLAGFLHDLGKARAEWQRYLQGKEAERPARAVPHAYFGAAVLAALGQDLLRHLSAWEAHRGTWLRWVRDVADHHGELGDIEDAPPWRGHWHAAVAADVDWPGVARALAPHLPPTFPVPAWLHSGNAVHARVHALSLRWRQEVSRWKAVCVGQLEDRAAPQRVADACLRAQTGRLIAADRMDSGQVQPAEWQPSQAEAAIAALEASIDRTRHGTDGGTNQMDGLRQAMRERALAAWRQNPDAPFFALTLPTGYGKTLTALRIALEAVRQNRARRIVYVAPHISILSQAAREIATACRVEVLEHHHLAVALSDEMDDASYLAMESWQAPVVATTFHQLFRALFPRRAQHTLRVPALENAFVLLDEPQMLDPRVWNVLLQLLAAASRTLGTQVLLVTATLPPTRYAGIEVQELIPAEEVPAVCRYHVRAWTDARDAVDEEDVAELAVRKAREVGQVGVLLNTVADALRVFRAVRQRTDIPAFFLHGMLQPIHKQRKLKVLREHLKREKAAIVVGTPILECGLNLSVRFLWRALSTIPSLVQSAGRVNRRGEGEVGEVWTQPFVRGGERSTREWLYRRREEREVTDALLSSAAYPAEEPDVLALLSTYYDEVFARNAHVAYVERMKEAALGQWSALRGLEPFEETVPTVTVFVPTGEEHLTEEQRERYLGRWGCRTAAELYERYGDPSWMRRLSFLERKRFLAALQAFSVPVVQTCAQRVAVDTERGIVLCSDPRLYDEELGFAALRDAEAQQGAWLW